MMISNFRKVNFPSYILTTQAFGNDRRVIGGHLHVYMLKNRAAKFDASMSLERASRQRACSGIEQFMLF